MPTVKTREFKKTSLSGEVYQFKAPITVDAKGEFTVVIPEEISDLAKVLAGSSTWCKHVEVDFARVHWRVSGRVLGEVERFVEDVIAEHLAVEVTKELVIRYRYENNAAGAKAQDGSLHPNGRWAAKPGESSEDRSWAWAGNRDIHATNRPQLFGVGVVARVYMKVTYKRPSGSKVEYTDDLPGSHWDQNPMRRLNDFLVQRPDYQSSFTGYMKSSKLSEMPYSDAAAAFFCDLMLAMLRLGEQLDAFVGDPKALQLAIERGDKLIDHADQVGQGA